MAIPPYPSQDLAKLVLGYLIEEQLMTAYDEFLQQSPYLDAQKNEYDRIDMKPLRHLLGEYRAVKIYVENCKPLSLRKKLFQCSSLLEVVKFLVQYVDVKRLQEDLSRDHVGTELQEANSRTGCDACQALKLDSCVCSSRRRNVSSISWNNSESVEMGRSTVLNTSLSELPGNQNLENRHSGVSHQTNQSNIVQQDVFTHSYPAGVPNVDQNSIMPSLQVPPNHPITTTHTAHVPSNPAALECSQNIAEFNTVLNQVYNNSNVSGLRDNNGMICTENTNNNRIPTLTPGSYQDFSTQVKLRGGPNINVNVPDSSTSGTTENLTVATLPDKGQNKRTVKTLQKKRCAFRIGNVKHDVTEISTEVIDVEPDEIPPNPKPEENKVNILSNVRVVNDETQTPVPKHATSTPLLHMQTILINGTPIFRKNTQKLYTKDEIMSMPTLIIVPASGASQVPPTSSQPQNVSAQSCVTTSTYVPPSHRPLTVDGTSIPSNVTTNVPNVTYNVPHATRNVPNVTGHVPDITCSVPNVTGHVPDITCSVPNVTGNTPNVTYKVPNVTRHVPHVSCNVSNVQNSQDITIQDTTSQPGVVKTVEASKNASVPKDSIITDSNSTSTPQTQPPLRKSSSTPRRNSSHVRVLDFTTPRRILNETIDENPNAQEEADQPVEVMISKSPNVSFPRGSLVLDNSVTTVEGERLHEPMTPKQSISAKKKTGKVRDWDADLRALVAGSEWSVSSAIPKSTPKQKSTKKTAEKDIVKSKIGNTTEKSRKKSSQKKNESANVKLSKKKANSETIAKPEHKLPSPSVSPIESPIHTEPSEEKMDVEIDNSKNKPKDEDRIETPETERLSLRHEIGGKLNISDIFETPYKQALYEITMDTPRFLGPELPGEPGSDIKITDIPTPRFLTENTPFTPKPTQATPSSYSSRPTDYSSGGSYYKPDDQDYLRIVDEPMCPVTSTHSKDNSYSKVTETEVTTKPDGKESRPKRNRSRPVRQCTKNVSYYNSPMTAKITDSNKNDESSSCSDVASANTSLENAISGDVPTTPRNERVKQSARVVNKKNLSNKRSPHKKVSQQPFMKIKPRRPTQTKDTERKANRKSSESSQTSFKGKPKVRNSKVSGHSISPAPTKRRRKSATPRKLHRTELFTSSDRNSPDENEETPTSEIQNSSVSCVQDSDTEQLPLRWSDDGSQDAKAPGESGPARDNETDDISKIQEYIDKTMESRQKDYEGSLKNDDISKIKEYINQTMDSSHKENEASFQNHLVERGFDIETAKKIERDLLSTPVPEDRPNLPVSVDTTSNKILERSIESDCSTLPNNLVINEDEEIDEDEFTVHDCEEGKENYLIVQHDGVQRPLVEDVCKLKDNFNFEVSFEGVKVNMRAPPYNILIDEDFQDIEPPEEVRRETELAVSSISNIDRLYTPIKDMRAQCYSIFDSTLTSIDTPLKADSPIRTPDVTVTEIVIEEVVEERKETKEKTETKKRKRLHRSSASDESMTDYKRIKPETVCFLQRENIIDVVLTKLHGSEN